MAVTTLLGLPIPSMSETVGKTIPDLATAMQMIDQKLGGVRIVDHNLDVASPPNGYYARWENGLQICWHILEGTNTDPQNTGWHVEEGFVDWTIPASFVDELLVLALASGSGWHAPMLGHILDTDTATIRFDPTQPRRIIPYRALTYQNGRIYVRAFAVGRWK